MEETKQKLTTILFEQKSKNSSKRANFLKNLFKKFEDTYLVIDLGIADFDIYFLNDIMVIPKPREFLLRILSYDHVNAEKPKTILDIQDAEILTHSKKGSFATLSAISAGYLTCSSVEDQEEIYNNTGRIAYILNEKTGSLEELEKMIKLAKEDVFLANIDNYLEDEGVVL